MPQILGIKVSICLHGHSVDFQSTVPLYIEYFKYRLVFPLTQVSNLVVHTHNAEPVHGKCDQLASRSNSNI